MYCLARPPAVICLRRLANLHELLPGLGGTLRPSARQLEEPAVCEGSSRRAPSVLYCECFSISSSLCKIPATCHKYWLRSSSSHQCPWAHHHPSTRYSLKLLRLHLTSCAEIINVSRAADLEPNSLTHGRSIIVIAALTGINFLSSMSTSLLTVGLPRMAVDVKLPTNLLLWHERDSFAPLSL
jgi:hypothetical protein